MVTHVDARFFSGPFVWGRSDCCTCACDAFAARHGVDPMKPLRGAYATRRQALAAIRRFGGWREMLDGLAAQAGLTVDNSGAWADGALGLATINGHEALVFGAASGVWIGKVDHGFATVPSDMVEWACRRS